MGKSVEIGSEIESLVHQVLEELELELVEMDIFQAGKRKVFRIYIYREGGVSVDDCANVSRKLGPLIELEDLVPTAYTLEVSSPGLDRPLKTRRDFERNMGQMIRVSLEDKVAGKNFLIAELIGADDEKIQVSLNGDDGSQEFEIPYAIILNAKVEVQFNG